MKSKFNILNNSIDKLKSIQREILTLWLVPNKIKQQNVTFIPMLSLINIKRKKSQKPLRSTDPNCRPYFTNQKEKPILIQN